MRKIFNQFYQAADLEKAKKMAAYMRNQFPFLGISAPDRQKLAREFYQTSNPSTIDWDFVFECWEKEQREFQYLGTDYLLRLKKQLTTEDLPNIRQLIEMKSWWDTVDALDALLGVLALDNPSVESLMLEWSTDENFWIRRVAINHQLLRKEQTNTKLLEQIIVNNFGSQEFFINKAIGWSLRDYSKTNPDWVRDFLARHTEQMASLSIREASKYL
ncbi:DNA alkylation repair protein [Enterococcus sp. LJL98]